MGQVAPEPEEPEVPEWVLTFADMISLLVTFFILLMTYSSMEKEKYAKMAGAMAGAFGVISDPKTPDNRAMTDPPPTLENRVPRDGIRTSRKDLDRIQEQTKTLVRKPGVGNFIDFERIGQGLRIRITTQSSFARSSARLSAETKRVLREVADLLRIHSQPFVVIGHAFRDGDEQEAMDISAERALEAASYLATTGRVPQRRISVSARGDQQPLVDGVDSQATQENRRVEILILDGEE